ncbi:MAG: type II toxin-antitoxin system HipA family toxin YjjJ [Burkholderiaceae bacterium]
MPLPRISATIESLIAALGDEALSAAQLQERLGCSQPSLSRLVRAAGASVLTLGRAKQTRYARARATGAEQPITMTQIDAQGTLQPCGNLQAIGLLAGSRTVWTSHRRLEVYEGLPWFVADMRPQGFIGRQFPSRVPQLGLPTSVADWSDNHVLAALCEAGADEPGDLVLGRAALDRFLQQTAPEPISQRRKASVYPQLASDSAVQQHNPSSAVGEQSKFTAYVQMPQEAGHAIVKFSPLGSDPVAQRWRDLLRAEHHALAVLGQHQASTGLRAAQAQLIDLDRLYLEVRRFDRIGARGRTGVVSLGAIDDVYVGQRHNWVQTAEQLQCLRMLQARDVERIRLLYAFGLLIHNTDMHFGNLALLHDGPASKQFTLAPCYDMLPMRFAPTAQGLRPVPVPAVLPKADLLTVWPQAQELAREFWQRVIADKTISSGFKQIAKLATASAG